MQRVRRLFQAEKTGHTGTLDPLASGLLPLLFGQATRFSDDLIQADKRYVATLRFGFVSSTGDAEGQITVFEPNTRNSDSTRVCALNEAGLAAVLPRFVGEIEQVPPMYSALKKDGKALYEYARQGLAIDRPARTVRVHELHIKRFWHEGENTFAELEVLCGKGTYIRTLAEDIARAAGTGAYLTALRRTQVGGLHVEQAWTLPALETAVTQAQSLGNDLAELLAPVDSLLSGLPVVELELPMATRFCHGQRLPLEIKGFETGRVRVYCRAQQPEPRFLGTAFLETNGETALLRPERLIQDAL
ncbi:MAG: tRNA pseudouridine(55) synthase TruB [Limnobacter sp.]|nr:tRNA pseudouridine(55) synthase TruB [Limnobacter sp.]